MSAITAEKNDLIRILKLELGGVSKLFKKEEYDLDVKPLLRLVLSRTFGNSTNLLVDVMSKKFQNSKEGTENIVI